MSLPFARICPLLSSVPGLADCGLLMGAGNANGPRRRARHSFGGNGERVVSERRWRTSGDLGFAPAVLAAPSTIDLLEVAGV